MNILKRRFLRTMISNSPFVDVYKDKKLGSQELYMYDTIVVEFEYDYENFYYISKGDLHGAVLTHDSMSLRLRGKRNVLVINEHNDNIKYFKDELEVIKKFKKARDKMKDV